MSALTTPPKGVAAAALLGAAYACAIAGWYRAPAARQRRGDRLLRLGVRRARATQGRATAAAIAAEVGQPRRPLRSDRAVGGPARVVRAAREAPPGHQHQGGFRLQDRGWQGATRARGWPRERAPPVESRVNTSRPTTTAHGASRLGRGQARRAWLLLQLFAGGSSRSSLEWRARRDDRCARAAVVGNPALYAAATALWFGAHYALHRSLLFCVLPHMCFGVLFANITQWNHIQEAATPTGPIPDAPAPRSLSRTQAGACVDCAHNNVAWSLLCICLNFQTLHHILPGVSHHHFLWNAKLRAVIMDFLREEGIGVNIAAPVEAVASHVRWLSKVGAACNRPANKAAVWLPGAPSAVTAKSAVSAAPSPAVSTAVSRRPSMPGGMEPAAVGTSAVLVHLLVAERNHGTPHCHKPRVASAPEAASNRDPELVSNPGTFLVALRERRRRDPKPGARRRVGDLLLERDFLAVIVPVVGACLGAPHGLAHVGPEQVSDRRRGSAR